MDNIIVKCGKYYRENMENIMRRGSGNIVSWIYTDFHVVYIIILFNNTLMYTYKAHKTGNLVLGVLGVCF